MKILLIMGLPGAGKTTLADELAPMLNANPGFKAVMASSTSSVNQIVPSDFTHTSFGELNFFPKYWSTKISVFKLSFVLYKQRPPCEHEIKF